MDISEAIAGRRAVRDYTTEQVDEKMIRLLIADAVQAPSAINEQPWAFTVVRDQALLTHASAGAKILMLATTSATKKPSYFRTMMSNTNFQIFYHAPVLVLISATAPGAWIIEDCALAAENLMLGAYALGLGSCWIGSAKAYFKTPEGRTALSLPDAYEPVAPIILGYPSATAAPVTRKPPEIHWV